MITKQCLAEDLKNDKILFVSICPGMVETDMTRGRLGAAKPEEAILELFSTLSRFHDGHNGGFFNRDGSVTPF